MQHCMAIGAYRDQIFEWIHRVIGLQHCNWSFVMNMHKTFADFSVFRFEVHVTDLANSTIVFETCSTCFGIAFVCIDSNSASASFNKLICIV